MKKYELEQLLEYFIDICDDGSDPYREDDDKISQIRALASQAIDRRQDGQTSQYILPSFQKVKKKKQTNKRKK